jgi:hypothetical protein
MQVRTEAQTWLAWGAAALAVLPFGSALIALLVHGEDGLGERLLWALAVLAAIGLAVAPLACRRRSLFRGVAAVGAIAYLGGGFALAFVGGVFLWPAGLLLAMAAALPVGWSLARGLVGGVALCAALILVPLALYGAYACARPTPVLVVAFADAAAAERLGRLAGPEFRSLEADDSRARGFRIEFERGNGAARDAAARRFRAAPGVTEVRTTQERCDF